MYGRKNGGGTQVVHKWSLFEKFHYPPSNFDFYESQYFKSRI